MLRLRSNRLRRGRRRGATRIILGVARAVFRVGLAVALVTTAASIVGTARTTVIRPEPSPVVNDVTQLNPIPVARIVEPNSIDEVVAAIRSTTGPISVGGGRYSMGGQTATRSGIQIDMRRMSRILRFDSVGRTITVEAGARWRDIQQRIDPANLSVSIMQTYANFTVGGSLSVNVHGRYLGLGPLILSVRSLRVVLADGQLVDASPTTNPELFYGVVGGYGGLGVIVEATLDLATNVKVKRHNRVMPVARYADWFASTIRDDSTVVFHNADIYPDRYETVNAVSYSATDEPVTVPDRLIATDRGYRINRIVFWLISEWRIGKWLREHVVDPIIFRGQPVSWRNHEASYDVRELEPRSRAAETYVLQEYFVPVARLPEFVPRMGEILRRRDVNVINISIRHARPDPGSLLAWAKEEVFAYVLYYKQGTDEAARREVGQWTRELIDLAVSFGGAYYLPYQPWATDEQFHRAYPRAREFFALKRRLDPETRFRNTLWDRYYLPTVDPTAAPVAPQVEAAMDTVVGYRRDEGQTFLTHPEWYIVYSSEEYADWQRTRLPTEFPYLAAIGQYWANYREVRALTKHRYPGNPGYHVMLNVIGVSYSVELTLKAIYENLVGRVTGWLAGGHPTDEDRFAYQVHADYGRFIHDYPWYRYQFSAKLRELWTTVPLLGEGMVRKLERRLFLSTELALKAGYATLIERATAAAYAPEADRMLAIVTGWADSLAAVAPKIQRLAQLDSVHTLIATPRYDPFRDAMAALGAAGAPVRAVEVAGNDEIFITGVAPATWRYPYHAGRLVYSMPLVADSTKARVAISVPTADLIALLGAIRTEGRAAIDHVYDY